jgi:hypothetical protein
MLSIETDNLAAVRPYYAALGSSPGTVAGFYSPDILQEEFPNRFLPDGARRDGEELRRASRSAPSYITSTQAYILNSEKCRKIAQIARYLAIPPSPSRRSRR